MIRPTEDDASPETRFVRRVEPGTVPLPNRHWHRSPKLKEHAICLEPGHPHHAWLMVEGWDDNWIPCRPLRADEITELRERLNGR